MNKTAKKTPMHKASALYLPPDGYSRFFVIISLLEQLYGKNKKPITILDVGGCSPFLKELLDRTSIPYKLTILDILPKPPEITVEYIEADATKSDLPDGSFDVVVSTDTLEHIPLEIKDEFVRACARLSKDVCIMAAPFDTEGVHEGEMLVNDFNKKLFGVGQDWLEEHFQYGKPNVEQTCSVLDKLHIPYDHFGTNNLYSWIFSTHINLIKAKIGIGEKASASTNLKYNQSLAESIEFEQPTYRHFFVVYKSGRKTKKPDIVSRTRPQSFLQYEHEMFDLIADRMEELVHTAEQAQTSNAELELLLNNERVHSQKLNEVLEQQAAELNYLRPLRHFAAVRYPKQTIKKVKKKLSRDKHE